ncbi:MAG: glycosyltransferase [Bacteroidetes bacterium]|jgi:glycosyltransferase involved in cell wall biosynthesis|nr:glycosyltransferase [Bacteroidota bacterium]
MQKYSENTTISLFILKPTGRGVHYGIGTYLKYLIEALLTRGDIHIYVVNYLSDRKKEFDVEIINPRLRYFHIPPPKNSFNGDEKAQKYANRIVDFLTPFILSQPNVIFQTNYPDTLPIVKRLKSRFTIKVISVVHSAQWQFIFEGNKKQFSEAWQDIKVRYSEKLKPIRAEKELYEISDKVISVTSYMKDFMIEYFGIPEKKIEVVHNGIDIEMHVLHKSTNRDNLKQKMGFDQDEKIILYAGRLDKWKGIYILLDEFAELCNQHKNVRLVLVGEDSGPDKISQYLTHCKNNWSKVTFTGFVDFNTMQDLYQIADIGIIPSLYDHCPYVALEMISNNIPLIISDTEGLNEILTKDQCLYITPSIDDEGFVYLGKNVMKGALNKLLSSMDHPQEERLDYYPKVIESRFSAELMGSKMYSILLDLFQKTTVAVTVIELS